MARTMNTDGAVYRVVVVRKQYVANPQYRGLAWDHVEKRQVELSPGEERFIFSETETNTETYGPYERLGGARGMLTRHTKGGGWSHDSLVSAHIEKGRIIWEEYDEQEV